MAVERDELSDEKLWLALEVITQQVGKRLEKHGRGAFVSNHEALGVIAEEYAELIDAIRSNEPNDVAAELTDVAVSCVVALASMVAGATVETEESTTAKCTCRRPEEACSNCPDDPSPQYVDVHLAAERAREKMNTMFQKPTLDIN